MESNMETDKIPPPVKTTDSATALHLSYIRRDVDQQRIDMNKGFENLDKKISENNIKLDNMQSGFVSKVEFEDHETRIRVMEKSAEDLAIIKKLVYGQVAFVLLAVLSAVVYLVIHRST